MLWFVFCVCSAAENEESCFSWWMGRELGGVNLVVAVDPQLERHPPSKLVSFASDGNVVGVDLALDVDVLVDGDVQELDCHQRLRVVHLQEHAKGPALNVHFYLTLETYQNQQSVMDTYYYYY